MTHRRWTHGELCVAPRAELKGEVMGKALAWHNDPALKAAAVERMRQHREADDFIQGEYLSVKGEQWYDEDGYSHDRDPGHPYRGCFHGCLTTDLLLAEGKTLDEIEESASWHRAARRLFGFPLALGAALDTWFEKCDTLEEASRYAVAITEAIPVGADLYALDLDKLADEVADTRNYELIYKALAQLPIGRVEE